jgi:biotin transport system substrate-specific component
MQTVLTNRFGLAQARAFGSTIPGKLTLGVAATVVIALAAHVAFPLPFTPVPFTLQPLAVLGVGLAFGPVGGFLTLLAYLAEGACGLPVFSPAGPGGIGQLFFGPTSGYLLSYPLVAAIAGGLTRLLGRRL